MIIDAHTHVIPPSLVDRVRSGQSPFDATVEVIDGRDWMVHGPGFRYPVDDVFVDPGRRIDEMNRRGVDEAIVSLAPPFLGYELDGAEAIDHARTTNDALAEMVGAHDRLHAVATLPMQDPHAAAAELARAVKLGLVGAQVGAQVNSRPLDASEFTPVFQAAEELGVPLIIHPAYTGPTPGLEDFYLTNLCGNPWQTGVCASRLILSGALDRHPRLQVLLVHGGGHLPYQVGRLDHGTGVRNDAGNCDHQPSSYLRRFHYDTLVYSPLALTYLVGLVGADRVVYGSDQPFDMDGGPPAWQLDGVALAPEDLDLIVRGNAARLFGLADG